jgi:hypothetical protein
VFLSASASIPGIFTGGGRQVLEAHPFLPHDQNNRGNLSGQGQAGHLRSHPFGKQSRVKFLERTWFYRSDGGSTLKQILQIVIAVSIQSTNRDLLLGFLQPAVFPERSLGAEALRCLKGRPFWSGVLSVRLEPLQKGTPFL